MVNENKAYRMAADGHIYARNFFAWWIPELHITEVIGGTTYTVSGSYEGEGDFLRKLERITAKNISEELGVC